MIALVAFDADGATFTDAQRNTHRLLLADLLALAREGRNPRSGQRVPGFLARRSALVGCLPETDGWRLTLADGSIATIAAAELSEAFSPILPGVEPRVWTAADPAPPVHDYQAVMAEDAARLACLRQVLSHGFARLSGVPAEPGTVAAFLGSFGPVRETNYGVLFDVRVRPDPANLADSALALLPHTDNPYRAAPPDLQALHALVAAADGGETWLVDGQAIVAHLRAQAPAALALLAEVPVRFAWSDETWHLEASKPVIALARDGGLLQIRANSRSIDRPLEADPLRRAQWWAAWDLLETCLADPAFALTFTLDAGELVLMDNRRVLHGRTAFTGGQGERHLQGAYADIDGLTSSVHRLAWTRAAAAIDELEQLFLAPAMDDQYGEAISIHDHMLQSAELASAGGLGEEGIAAALLHDIGWAPEIGQGRAHEHAAADRLAAIFGMGVADPVRWHVEAKRYLVARRPDYRGRLSQASIQTLTQQGGAMNESECLAFEALAGHRQFVALRELDDAGKQAAPPQTRWADYRPLLIRLAVKHALNG